MFRKILVLLIVASALALTLSTCAVQQIIDMVNNPKEINIPRWNIEFEADILETSITVGSLFDVETMLGDLDDISFEKVSDPDNVLGLQIGDYMLRYPIEFPPMDNFSSTDVTGDFDSLLGSGGTPPFNMKLIMPYWPLPADVSYDLSDNSLDIISTSVKLNDLSTDIDGDGVNDISLSGISFKSGIIYIEFAIFDGTAPTTELKPLDVAVEDFVLEGITYNMTYDTELSDANKVVFSASLSAPFYFANDASPDAINLDNFKFSVKGDETLTIFDIMASENYNRVLKISGGIDIEGDFSVIGDFEPLYFDLGSSMFLDMGSMADIFSNNTSQNLSDSEKLQNTLMSSISFAGTSLILDVTNDMFFDLDLTKLFNGTSNYVLNPPNDPAKDLSVSLKDSDGGLFSYFDTNGDGINDSVSQLDVTGDEPFVISGNSKTQLVLPRIGGFLQKEVDGKQFMVDKLFIGKTIDIGGKDDVELSMDEFSKSDILSIKGELLIPLALSIPDDSNVFDMMSIIGFQDFSQISQYLGMVPLSEIDTLTISLDIENKLPIGLELDLILIADPSTDMQKTVSLTNNGAKIESGLLAKSSSGFYYVDGGQASKVEISMGRDFKYTDHKGIDQVYNGDLLKLVDESDQIKMKLNLQFLPSDGKSIVISNDDAVKVKVSFFGKTALDLGKLMGN